MSLNSVPIARSAPWRNPWPEIAFAAIIAALGWFALTVEFDRSITASLAKGRSLSEALFLYFRFFTNLSNIGVATLMSVTVVRAMARRPLPAASLFNAALVYMLVTCVTYEFLLRSTWAPHGMQFFTDMVVHDLIPALMLVFWFAFAPRDGVRWRDALRLIAFPAAYLVMTLVAGGLGEGYPYNFLDVDKLGLPSVMVVALIFLAVFYALGLMATALSMAWSRPRIDRAAAAGRAGLQLRRSK